MSNSQQQPQPSPLLGSRRPANATGSSSTSSSWPNKQPVRPSSRALAAASDAVAHASSAATAGRLGVGRKSAAASKLWGSLSSFSSSSSTNNPKAEPKKRVTAGGCTSSITALQNSSRQQPASIRAAATTRAAASACRRVLGAGSVSSTTTAATPTAVKQSYASSSCKAPAGCAAQSSTDNSEVGYSSQLSASAPFVSRAVHEQRRLANQLAKQRVHQLLGERQQQQQQGAKQAGEVVIITRRGIQDAAAAQVGEQVAKAAVETVHKYQRWDSAAEATVAAARFRVDEALASQVRELRQKAPGCCSSSVLHYFRALFKTSKWEHQLFHLALAQAQQS